MRKKIIGVALTIAILAILSAQSVLGQTTVYVWTDKIQYKPGEAGTLKISVLNEGDDPIEIKNITIMYPWFSYDAQDGEWVGNETITLEPAELLSSNGGKYYKSVDFTIPTDGRVTMEDSAHIAIWTSDGIERENVQLPIAATSLPMSLVGLDTWMTYLIVALVVCTIILAVVLAATRRAQASTPRVGSPRAKAE